jgi:hypothetical protein
MFGLSIINCQVSEIIRHDALGFYHRLTNHTLFWLDFILVNGCLKPTSASMVSVLLKCQIRLSTNVNFLTCSVNITLLSLLA